MLIISKGIRVISKGIQIIAPLDNVAVARLSSAPATHSFTEGDARTHLGYTMLWLFQLVPGMDFAWDGIERDV